MIGSDASLLSSKHWPLGCKQMQPISRFHHLFVMAMEVYCSCEKERTPKALGGLKFSL